jgi:hypothetical protein
MEKSSIVNTGSVAGVSVALASIVDWVLNAKLGLAAPPTVVGALAAGLITVGHFICNRWPADKPVIGENP